MKGDDLPSRGRAGTLGCCQGSGSPLLLAARAQGGEWLGMDGSVLPEEDSSALPSEAETLLTLDPGGSTSK